MTMWLSALTDYLKTVLFEDAADFSPGEDAKLTHEPLQAGDKHLSMQPAFDFGGIGAFEKKLDGFLEILGG
jgi:hypothetical protein